MDEFIYICDIPKLNQDQINKFNTPIAPTEIEAVIKIFKAKQTK